MRQVMICGRGGQGAMAAAEVLAAALWSQGKLVQAFPSFQPEKKGAPTAAFVRYDEEDIWLRCEIDFADIILVLDSAAISSSDVSHKLALGGLLIGNGSATSRSLQSRGAFRTAFVNATQIAIHHKLGTRLLPQVNMLMLGALARLTPDLPLPALEDAVAAKATSLTDDLRLAIDCPARQPRSIGRDHVNDIAIGHVALDARDRAGKDPRVMLANGLVAAWLEDNVGHHQLHHESSIKRQTSWHLTLAFDA